MDGNILKYINQAFARLLLKRILFLFYFNRKKIKYGMLEDYFIIIIIW